MEEIFQKKAITSPELSERILENENVLHWTKVSSPPMANYKPYFIMPTYLDEERASLTTQ